MGDYIPQAPINDEAKKANGNLPGMGGVFNVVNLHLYHYAGHNPVKYVDPDGKASILQRVINKGSDSAYNFANKVGSATKIPFFLHGLIDRGKLGGLDADNSVSQYSGPKSGFTSNDRASQTSEYIIRYSGMDDKLTDEAINNVLNFKQFGSGDNQKAKSLYKLLANDCNTYTSLVFKEYKKLWLADFKKNNHRISNSEAKKAWANHYKEITKDSGKTVIIED